VLKLLPCLLREEILEKKGIVITGDWKRLQLFPRGEFASAQRPPAMSYRKSFPRRMERTLTFNFIGREEGWIPLIDTKRA